TWQKDQSQHYLSNCVDKESDVVFRRARQNAVAQTADPTGPRLIPKRREIASQELLQFVPFTQQQSLIEVALNKTVGKEIEGLAKIPTGINSDSGQATIHEKLITQVSRLSA